MPQMERSLSVKETIARKAIQLLAPEPEGLRHSVLLDRLKAELPQTPFNTIRGTLVALAEYKPAEVFKPAKGLFQHVKYKDVANSKAIPQSTPTPSVREESF